MSIHNTELVRRHSEQMWNQRDFAACDGLMAEDYVEHGSAPFGTKEPGRVHRPTATRETMKWLLDQFPDFHMQIEAVISDMDLVAATVRSTGSNLGPLNGFLPPSGKSFRSCQSHWFRVGDGKLTEHWATRDDFTTMLQLWCRHSATAGHPAAADARQPPLLLATATLSDSLESVSHVEATMAAPQSLAIGCTGLPSIPPRRPPLGRPKFTHLRPLV